MTVTAIRPESEKAETAPEFVFDTSKRCDSCGAQAYVRAILFSGLDLLFCGHHGHAVEDVLMPQCDDWFDETDKLKDDNRNQGSDH